jgi:hypothetical protein
MHKYLISAAVGFVGVFALATTASAAVVCNEDGDCWRVKEKYDYRPDWGLTVYDDDWKWTGDKYRWRDPGATGVKAFGLGFSDRVFYTRISPAFSGAFSHQLLRSAGTAE